MLGKITLKDIATLVIIPARAGSKGIYKKNLKMLNNKPLIQHTIDFAKTVQEVSAIVVSTDDKEIEQLSLSLGVDVVQRPKDLSTDVSIVKDAIQYTVRKLEEDGYIIHNILLLEPTSPLRKASDIIEVISKLESGDVDSVATFSKSSISPGRLWKIDGGRLSVYLDGSNPWLPRQQQPVAYELNGLVYGFSRESLMKYESENSILVGNIDYVLINRDTVDIDNELDFLIAEKIIESGGIR